MRPHSLQKGDALAAEIIDGKEMASQVRAEVAEGVRRLLADSGIRPGLAAVLVGEVPASEVYVRNKIRACQEVGILTETFHLEATVPESQVISLVHDLNADPRFHGILVQLPLPDAITERHVIVAIDPDKDVDGLHPLNGGLLLQGQPRFIPATPAGIQQMLLRSGNDPAGKHVVVCGRSNIVGKPLAALLLQKAPGANATVTLCHTGTQDLGAITRQADILVAAMGSPQVITGDMVKPGAVVIDVGINRVDDPSAARGYRLVGDVDFDSTAPVAGAISPVPGGVGPMTIAMLLSNTLRSAQYSTGTTD